MLIVQEIIEKLKDIISKDNLKDGKVFDKDVAEALNITQANFATMKNRAKIPYTNILEFCAKKKISINWLLYNQNPSSLVDSTDKYWIKYFPSINVSAGGGAYDEDEDEFESLEIPSYFISMLGGKQNIKNIHAINVIGDSMEPTLNSDDIIFIDKTKNSNLSNQVYAYTTKDGLFVKRLIDNKNGRIDVISDNSSYLKQELPYDEINVLGKVVGSFGMIY